ncbi:MAG: hypothetical protein L0G87_02675 [Renibacterium salmoninarum]|jgi:hypothetical protein|nr:hypothetical protein [Renibacterium salmoninarum]
MALRRVSGSATRASFFGSGIDRSQVKAMLICAAGTAALFIFFNIPGLAIGAVVTMVVWVVTSRTANGSVATRALDEQRWRERLVTGAYRFVPFTPQGWEAAKELSRSKDAAVAERGRALMSALRSRPDGADGMGWLISARGVPGVAWHAPMGEDAYFSVVFSVGGMFSGAVGSRIQEAAQTGFSKLLVSQAPVMVLCSGVQVITRVMPPDTVKAAAWVDANIALDAHPEATNSYAEVLARTAAGAFIQEHMVVFRVPLTSRFRAEAARFGTGREGYRELMRRQTRVFEASLKQAGFTKVSPMTARATASMIIHQQNPSHPSGAVRDVDPREFGVASKDAWNAHVVTGKDSAGQPVQWFHRTCRITSEDLRQSARSPFWLLPLLRSGRSGPVTISVLHEVIPASDAMSLTNKDLVRTLADAGARQKKGQVGDLAQDERVKQAKAQRNDLAPGEDHHGDNWLMYATLTSTSFAGLDDACEQFLSVGQNNAGIAKVTWMDTYQSAASGCTWPIFRGLKPYKPSIGANAMNLLTGSANKNVTVK